MNIRHVLTIFLWSFLIGAPAQPDYKAAALELDASIERSYAYLDKLPGGVIPKSTILDAKRDAVMDEDTLLRYAEDRMASLADHHAITGSSFDNSWAVIPTYSDLWVVARGNDFIVDAVRQGSPASKAGIDAGAILIAVNGEPIDAAVRGFWAELGLPLTAQRAAYAAQVLVAGRRDRNRIFTVKDQAGVTKTFSLPSLYTLNEEKVLVSVETAERRTIIRINNSLGDTSTIAAFDAAMAQVPAENKLIIDLRDTPSGGNTTVARAIMGWFVDKPTGYQVHSRPEEERESGIARQWIEQVLPRQGKHRSASPTILVGRWTGSMGEGLAIGFASFGADIQGTRMAELNGSVEDILLGNTNLSIKLPTERLMTTGYLPREQFVPTTTR
ncbi:S41 family peptidase [Sphingorhabdus arenilitoris]|uniref:S41 family peptidase n=1 Tax=Sphingorhabdus arenilitoris TaxID=1490041 RepID=A0ABV8RGM0_9SPHN